MTEYYSYEINLTDINNPILIMHSGAFLLYVKEIKNMATVICDASEIE